MYHLTLHNKRKVIIKNRSIKLYKIKEDLVEACQNKEVLLKKKLKNKKMIVILMIILKRRDKTRY
jgi:hypothetical protein